MATRWDRIACSAAIDDVVTECSATCITYKNFEFGTAFALLSTVTKATK
jgi:hypothetical protein